MFSKPLFALLATVFLWSSMVVVSRHAVLSVSGSFLLFLRLFVAALAFFPFFIKSRVWKKKKFKELAFVSLGSTTNLTFFMFGIQYTSASASQIIYAAMPILVLLVDFIFLKKKETSTKMIGVAIGFLGLLYIVYLSSLTKEATISGNILGNLLVVVAMLGWTTYLFMSKKMSKYFSPTEIGSTTIIISFLISFFVLLGDSIFFKTRTSFSFNILVSAFYIGFGGTFLTYILYQYAIKYLSSLSVSLSSYIQPVVTTFLAVLFLSEKIDAGFLLGSFLVFVGVFLTSDIFKRKKT